MSADSPSSWAFIALGSNLGDSPAILREALRRLREYSDEPLVTSSLWQSTPVDCPPGSPLFVNAVAGLIPRPEETPEKLLTKLQALETDFGRQPKQMLNEARPLDLDLITFGIEVRSTLQLTLPHPRAHQRRFVLEPLHEIAPDFVLPSQTASVRALLAALSTNEVLSKLG